MDNLPVIANLRSPKADGIAWPRIAGYNDHIEFDFSKCISTIMPYSDVFTADGRIITRITPERNFIKNEMQNNSLLKKLKPSLPYSDRNLRGYWSGLDSGDRYQWY